MCGFAGLLDPTASDTTRVGPVAERMAATLAHRGPDAAGSWSDPEAGIALGFRRLAILDLTSNGDQPMLSPSGRWVLACNGEVYNFRELRRQLAAAGGFSPRGGSDSEVAVAAIERFGLDRALERFVGMFALALWDRERRELHLVRDRLGVKPLYYGLAGGAFVFGSELRALAAHPRFVREVDRGALALHLRHGYVPGPHAIVRGVRKLPPGSVLTLRAEHLPNVPEPRRWWSLAQVVERGTAEPYRGTAADAADELERVLADAVAVRLEADVPLGVFLSGGVDSSLVTALMAARGGTVRTFTIGSDDPAHDESAHARRIASHLGTQQVEHRVTGREALELLPRLATVFDEPFADSSQVPTYLLCALARRHVTVALSGDGGDELFAGYERYRWLARLWSALARVPRGVRRGAARAIASLPAELWSSALAPIEPLTRRALRLRAPGEKLVRLAALLGDDTPERMYLDLVSHAADPARLVLGADEPTTLLGEPDHWPAADDLIARLTAVDTLTYLPDDILVKVDRASMAVGLEAREPLLDHRLVELVWRLPPALRHGDGAKALLREVLHRYVPREIMGERPKKGFSVPLGAWLRGPLRDWGEALLDPARLAREGLLDVRRVRALWEAHLDGRREVPHLLWSVLMFQAWQDAAVG